MLVVVRILTFNSVLTDKYVQVNILKPNSGEQVKKSMWIFWENLRLKTVTGIFV